MTFRLSIEEAQEAIAEFVGKKYQPDAPLSGYIYLDDEHNIMFEVGEEEKEKDCVKP